MDNNLYPPDEIGPGTLSGVIACVKAGRTGCGDAAERIAVPVYGDPDAIETTPAASGQQPTPSEVTMPALGVLPLMTTVPSQGQPAPLPITTLAAPIGPTAICMDGTYSYSLNHSGTCSHHGGVRQWLR